MKEKSIGIYIATSCFAKRYVILYKKKWKLKEKEMNRMNLN